MDNKELWKPIEHNPNLMISSKGRVLIKAHANVKEEIRENFFKDKDGYSKINIRRADGKYTQASVHRLVAEAFIPNPENKQCVNHKDSNRSNNSVENLEWVTHKENVYHSYLFGNRKKCKSVPKNTLLTDFQISQINFLRQHYTVNQLAKLFNIEYQSLKNIIHKKKQCEKLDNQQPSTYNNIYLSEGSTTIPDGSRV